MILLKMLSDHKHSSLSTTVDGAGLAKVRQKYEGARKEVGTESPAPAKIQKFLRSDLHNSSTECEVIWTMCLKFLEFHLACLGQALRISTSIEKPRGTTKVLQFRTRALSGFELLSAPVPDLKYRLWTSLCTRQHLVLCAG